MLRVDERCDTDRDGIIEAGETTWRTVEVNTHKPGSLGALIGKRVYVYSDAADSSPNGSNDYTYTYDALGNVQVVYKASGTVGHEAYFFTQDAFGNELSGGATADANRTNLLGGATWASARTAGITEHQTGKIQSAFSGLQYFGARWYDPVVGRFVGRDPIESYFGKTSPCDSHSGLDSKKSPEELQMTPQLLQYIYVLNSPTNLADPTGLFSTCLRATEWEASWSWFWFSAGGIFADVSTNNPCVGHPSHCRYFAPIVSVGVMAPRLGVAYRYMNCCKRDCNCLTIDYDELGNSDYAGLFLGVNTMAGGSIGGSFSPSSRLGCFWIASFGWQLGIEMLSISYYFKAWCEK